MNNVAYHDWMKDNGVDGDSPLFFSKTRILTPPKEYDLCSLNSDAKSNCVSTLGDKEDACSQGPPYPRSITGHLTIMFPTLCQKFSE